MGAVKAGANAAGQELADIGAEEIAKQLKEERTYSLYKVLKHEQENINTTTEAREYRKTVQEQVEQLDNRLNQIQRQISVDAERIQILNSMKEAVQEACTQKPIYIKPLP